LDAPEVQERSLGTDPGTGLPVLARVGPYGPYVQLGNGDGQEKPKRVSIPKGMTLEDMSLNYGLLLLSLPRALGVDPKTKKEVTVGIGRYGPYVHRGGTYRNLKSPVQLFEIELDEAIELLETQPGREVLKELGPHPSTGVDLKILDGRYGPYVTDGSVNASIPKGADPKDVEMDEAVDLLEKAAARKGKGKGRKRGGARGKGKGGAGKGGRKK